MSQFSVNQLNHHYKQRRVTPEDKRKNRRKQEDDWCLFTQRVEKEDLEHPEYFLAFRLFDTTESRMQQSSKSKITSKKRLRLKEGQNY